MTKEELAARLNGREYGREITEDEEAEVGRDRPAVDLRGALI